MVADNDLEKSLKELKEKADQFDRLNKMRDEALRIRKINFRFCCISVTFALAAIIISVLK